MDKLISLFTNGEKYYSLVVSSSLFAVIAYFFRIKFLNPPRLTLRVSPLYFQWSSPDNQYEVGWRFQMVIHNNSSRPAYELALIEPAGQNLLNTDSHKRMLQQEGNQIGANAKLEVEGKYSTKVNWAEHVLNIDYGGTVPIMLPGMKVQPEIYFRPEGFDRLEMLLRYKSEDRGNFYTKFYVTQNDNRIRVVTNEFYRLNPYSSNVIIRIIAKMTRQVAL